MYKRQGLGFIGTNFCLRLLGEGYNVVVLDNASTGTLENLDVISEKGDVQFFEADICNPLPKIDCDLVVNLACPASPVHYQADPIATTKTSVLGVINLLEYCAARDLRLIHASTSEVYGDPQIHPQREDYVGHVNPIGPRACYDEGKRCAESLIHDYARIKGVRADVVRIFNTYGPFMQINDGRVVSNFVVQALKGDPITIYGDGAQTRSMCFVDDMVDALLALIQKEDGVSGPVNLGNPSEISVRDFADLVLEMTGSASQIEFRELPQDDPIKRKPDITKATQVLGWSPKVELRAGLARTIDYFKPLV